MLASGEKQNAAGEETEPFMFGPKSRASGEARLRLLEVGEHES